VIAEGGAFADSGAPRHAAEQNVVENCRRLADACRTAAVPVIHVWYLVEDGAKALKPNAPLFAGVREWRPRQRQLGRRAGAGARTPARRPGRREDADERLAGHEPRVALRGLDRDQVIVTGAWTNMSIEHTARSGADKGYFMFVPDDCCPDDERRLAQRIDQLRTAERLDGDELRRGRRRDRRVALTP